MLHLIIFIYIHMINLIIWQQYIFMQIVSSAQQNSFNSKDQISASAWGINVMVNSCLNSQGTEVMIEETEFKKKINLMCSQWSIINFNFDKVPLFLTRKENKEKS